MPIIVNLDVMMAKRKMSLNELSEKVDLTLSNLSILKTGKAKAVRFSTLEAICKALDYQTSNIIGKPVGIDIKEQKMTLPLIYTLKNANPENYKKYFATIKRYNNDSKKVRELVEFVKSSGGMDYAITVMKDYQQKALDILAEFPDNDAKKALKLMLDYVIERKL